jgi:hypothetical protein
MTSLRTLRLPRIELPVDTATVREVHRSTLARCRELGLIGPGRMSQNSFDRGAFALLSALTYPHAQRDALVLCNDFMTYLFFVDDQAEEDVGLGQRPELLGSYFRRHVSVLRGDASPAADDPAGKLLASVRERLASRASTAWLARFADGVEAYLLRGTLAGACHWTEQTVPSVAEYTEQRIWDSAVLCAQDLLEVSGGGELDARFASSAELAALRRLCARVVAFTNDLVSYGKEVREHASPNNLVHVIMHHERRSLDDAVARVMRVVERDVEQFERCVATAPAQMSAHAPFVRYVHGQRAWMRGNLMWSLATGRYSHACALFPELLPRPSVALAAPAAPHARA